MEVLSFLFKAFPALFNCVWLLSKQLFDLADDFKSFLLDDILIQSHLVIFVEDLQTFNFLINFFSLLDWYCLQESAYLELCCSNDFFLFLIWCIFFVLVAIRLKHLALGIQVSELLEKALLLLKELSDSLVEIYLSNIDF